MIKELLKLKEHMSDDELNKLKSTFTDVYDQYMVEDKETLYFSQYSNLKFKATENGNNGYKKSVILTCSPQFVKT